ncbi:S-adenosylmethionine decarboxylase proenzyme, prokaryotic class 1B [Marinobacterium lacunae]|uniref:S-adenosylmethionine decarboxylase proenzyme n=1 Tax=Marinobacterium lacunae TaxID=1232683 RepID=A0A081FZ59_9GAMM|nr:adenosylmethionine decarboxylase [Marinobacterium lacunae]KEA63814.1 S-adenosylmethionine decarboxylase proenzyme, prokaryotic class 1B [Marinobacterium lacunae]MBR9882522.1 adenosylmethionine decarboxylase [Oceanospirillales bacterium]
MDDLTDKPDQPLSNGDGDWPGYARGDDSARKDYFIERAGYRFAGTHLIIDLLGASNLDELERMEHALRDSVRAAGATLLHLHLHHFTPNGGISGVAVLAESHISVHTWPERDFAAFDVFMCGKAKPEQTIAVLEAAFEPRETRVQEILRGRIAIDDDDHLR